MPNARFYSRTQIVLHWLIMVLIFIEYASTDAIEALWQARMSGALPNAPVPDHHVAIGIALFVLTLWRLWLFVRNGPPRLPRTTPSGFRFAVRTLDALFYVLIFALGLSGMSAWFFGNIGAARLHGVAEALLMLVIFAHVGTALAQQFWLKTNMIGHMIGRH